MNIHAYVTKEKAIAHLQSYVNNEEAYTDFHREVCRMAISAIQAQQELFHLNRNLWKGCPHCSRWETYGYRNYEPTYCRDCGTPLNEEAWKELEKRVKESVACGVDKAQQEIAKKEARLAAYEKHGLEPCDYETMKGAMDAEAEAKDQLSEVLGYIGCSGLDHLRELVRAEKEGRLIISTSDVPSSK